MAFNSLIIPAAGAGTRMGSNTPKQFLPLNGKTILEHNIDFFEKFHLVDEIIIAVHKEKVTYIKEIITKNSYKKVTQIVHGGNERQDSVYNGLIVVDDRADVVLVHDAVRPFPPAEAIETGIHKALEGKSCILAIPVADTLKKADAEHKVISTIDRSDVYAIQTPQIFPTGILKMAYEKARREQFTATDEGMIIEHAGFPVYLIHGSPYNLKITNPGDMELAKILVKMAKYHE